MNMIRFRSLAALAALIPFTLATPAEAQKVGKTWHEDPHWGFKFKPLDDYKPVPIQSRGRETALVNKFDGDQAITRTHDGTMVNVKLDLLIYALTEEESEEEEEGRTTAKSRREDVAEHLARQFMGFEKDLIGKPDEDDTVSINRIDVRHRTWKIDNSRYDLWIDTWNFPLDHADICLVYTTVPDDADDYMRQFYRSARTFREIERVVSEKIELTKGASYEDQLKRAQQECSRTPGWRALETPSKKYIVKTSSEDDDFVEEVIERLEKSREIYERDFPPPESFDDVSIVRICSNQAEFHQYGGTGGGTAGWFSPATTELVLYDALNIDRNMTFAVMSHEAFHQYCHFLFDQSEAHRWFDEGHGDYYGGIEFRGRRAEVSPQMPGGLDRLTVIRQMVRDESYKPLWEHVNYDHGEWQTQGPSNVSCYAQSWSIVYFLRQGALGDVHRACWESEYADIIPNYVKTLHQGFLEAYDELRTERAERAGGQLSDEDADVNRFHLPPGKKDEIWEKATAASWGQIDMEEFEENWLLYIDKYLK